MQPQNDDADPDTYSTVTWSCISCSSGGGDGCGSGSCCGSVSVSSSS